MVSWGPRHIYGRGVSTDLFRRRGIEGRTPSEVSGRVASGVALVAAKNPMAAGMSTHHPAIEQSIARCGRSCGIDPAARRSRREVSHHYSPRSQSRR